LHSGNPEVFRRRERLQSLLFKSGKELSAGQLEEINGLYIADYTYLTDDEFVKQFQEGDRRNCDFGI
jgi:hypothetical protein